MAKKIWYVGYKSSGVTLTNDHWKQRVGQDQPELKFDMAHGFAADAEGLTSAQLKWFESQPDFYIVDTELAERPASAVPVLPSSGGTTSGGGGGSTAPTTAPTPAGVNLMTKGEGGGAFIEPTNPEPMVVTTPEPIVTLVTV